MVGVPDLILSKNETSLVVDVAFVFEQNAHCLFATAQGKKDKYAPFKDAVKITYPGTKTVQFYGFVVSARGKWPANNFSLLEKIGLLKTRRKLFAKILSRRALLGSIKT